MSSYIEKKIYFSLLLIMVTSHISLFSANDYGFAYDASGNRTQRTILVLRSGKLTEDNVPREKEAVTDSTLVNHVINIYPNPTKGHLTINIKNLIENKKASLTIHDIRGQLLITKEDLQATTELDISSYPSANYILRIVVDGKITEWKIIKQ